jgi:hypothetical protein
MDQSFRRGFGKGQISGAVLAESSPAKQTYERKIVERFGGQREFEFIVPPQPETKEAAN